MFDWLFGFSCISHNSAADGRELVIDLPAPKALRQYRDKKSAPNLKLAVNVWVHLEGDTTVGNLDRIFPAFGKEYCWLINIAPLLKFKNIYWTVTTDKLKTVFPQLHASVWQ